ncbi:MAG: OmpH family outer membrane protein [Bacteroidaceae bacterium]|nr:OmpH family outer membrane protein [Bacteroidaceae bacterium]
MKRNLLILLVLVATSAIAQSKFGYVSYKEIVKALPEYAIVTTHIDELQAKYEAEIARSEREFNQKYSDFIEEQAGFPENIRIKRHKELQELMEKSIEFKDEVNRAMREARHEMMKPLYEKVDEAVMTICIDEGYDYILNTDERVYIAINPNNGKDITARLKKALNVE